MLELNNQNFRKAIDKSQENCSNCVKFWSFRDLDDDDLEDTDYGRCSEQINDIVGYDTVCNIFQTKIKQ